MEGKVAFLTEILGRVPEDRELTLSPDARRGLNEILGQINDEVSVAAREYRRVSMLAGEA